MSGEATTIREAHPALYAWAYATEAGRRSFPDAEWVLTRLEARALFDAAAELLADAERGGHTTCPTCEQPLSEVETRVTGVCPTHGITTAKCGNPNCWCAQ